jgi:hypothetical protein
MSVPSIVKGTYFDVAVSLDGGTTFTAICGLTSRNLTESYQTSDEYIRDCSDPTSVPSRVVNVTGASFDIAGTGLYNRMQADLIRQIGGRSLPYRFIMGEDASDSVDSGYYQGNFVMTNKQLGAADGTNVTAQFSWASDGLVTFTPGADIIVLDPLTLTPRTALVGAAWTGTLAGLTAGSTVTAVSSDGTALTVSGATISGTFPAAGNKTITVTETLGAAPNSPRVSTFVVAASVALSALTMSPTTATHGTAYTGTITGKTTGSSIAATSSDGTTLSVSGTSVTGNFATAGTKTVTLVETLSGAGNSPKTSTVTITVS